MSNTKHEDAHPAAPSFVTHLAWFALATLTVVAVSAPTWKLAAAMIGA